MWKNPVERRESKLEIIQVIKDVDEEPIIAGDLLEKGILAEGWSFHSRNYRFSIFFLSIIND